MRETKLRALMEQTILVNREMACEHERIADGCRERGDELGFMYWFDRANHYRAENHKIVEDFNKLANRGL